MNIYKTLNLRLELCWPMLPDAHWEQQLM